MANRSNCYINDAYCGHYDSCEDISNFDGDDDEAQELYISENETFVDEENENYFRKQISKKYTPNKFQNTSNSNYGDRSLISLSPIRKTPNTTTSTPQRQIFKIANQSMPIIIPVRRCLDTQNFNYYNSNRKSNSVRNFSISSRPIRRSKSVNIVRPKMMKNEEKIVFSPNNSFATVPNISRFEDAGNLNSSVSSVQPFQKTQILRNTAIISPTYSKNPNLSAFEINSTPKITQTTISSPSKNHSWLPIPSQKIPICTLMTSAVILLIAGVASCLLSFRIMSKKGASSEFVFSFTSSFISICLGFPCCRFQQWQWLPNRNYVSGYIILSLFSMLQTSTLWFLDHYPDVRQEILDVTKGALCGISSLIFGMSVLGICSSFCCKYPPPDNRVSHSVVGFTV